MSNLQIGDIVFVVVDPRQNNGSDVAPAIVTRVWNENSINVKAVTDGPDNLWLTSIKLVDERPDEDDPTVGKDASGIQRVAFRAL